MCDNTSKLRDLVYNNIFYYNEDSPLFIRSVYDYDIERCFTEILKNENIIDLSGKEKFKANVTIGKMIKKDPELYEFLSSKTKDLLFEFLNTHNIKPEEIIAIERDGVLLSRFVKRSCTLSEKYTMILKHKFNMIIRNSENKKEFMMVNKEECRLKGMRMKPVGLENFLFRNLKNIDKMNKMQAFEKINNMRIEFFHTDDISLFAIGVGDNYRILTDGGDYEISKDSLDLNSKATDIKIDRKKYFITYLYKYLSIMALNYIDEENVYVA